MVVLTLNKYVERQVISLSCFGFKNLNGDSEINSYPFFRINTRKLLHPKLDKKTLQFGTLIMYQNTTILN